MRFYGYSQTMRELSSMDDDKFNACLMKWGFIPYEGSTVSDVGLEFYSSIPAVNHVIRNAVKQILAAENDSMERKEWADRIEGKATKTTVAINHDTKDGVKELEEYTKSKLDKLFNGLENE